MTDFSTNTIGQVAVRTQLLQRRGRLQTVAATKQSPNIKQLLKDVDLALESLETGSYGMCDICHEPIEEDWLNANPLARICLSHLSPEQQRAFERDLDLAADIQRALLPKPLEAAAGWNCSYHYVPAGVVSGDYCDVIAPQSSSADTLFLVGDVSGKGVAAALLMSHLHAIFRTLDCGGIPIGALMERVNRLFCESTLSTQFATLICVRVSISGQVELCSAGHCPALWIQEGSVAELEATGLPLGLFCEGEYSVQSLQTKPGDSIVLFTDGLSEARDPAGLEYGVPRLSNLVRNQWGVPVQALSAVCLEDLRRYQQGVPASDDLTLMVIQHAALSDA